MNDVGLLILCFIVLVSLFDFGIEYLHVKSYQSPIPRDLKNVYMKIRYDRHIKREKQSLVFATMKSASRVILFASFHFTGLFLAYDQFLESFDISQKLSYLFFIGGFFVLIFGIDFLVDLIKEFFVLKKKKSKKNIKMFMIHTMKRFGLLFGVGGLAIYLTVLLYEILGLLFFILSIVVIESVVILLSLFFTKILVLFLYKLKPLGEGELKEQIHVFLRQEGYLIEDVYVLEQGHKSVNMNAFVSGFSKRKRIVLFDTLVNKLTNDEIIAVIAHELGHQKHGHILYNMSLSFVFVSGFVLGLGLVMTNSVFSTSFGFDQNHIGFAILLYIFLSDGYILFVRFGLSFFSRKFEYQADKYASTVWYRSSLKSALFKIAKRSIEHLTPHRIYATIYFTHPTLSERLKELSKEEYDE